MSKIELSIVNHVGYITFNDPENANALNLEIEKDMLRLLNDCRYNDDVRVIVLQAEGKMFSGGGDVKSLLSAASDPEAHKAEIDESLVLPGTISKTIRAIPKPVIASIQGAVAGASTNITLMCDFRIVAENVMFVQPFINIALVTDGGGIYILNKILGAAKTTELVMLGKPVKAEEAYRLGLATEVVPNEELRTRTVKFAEKLARGPLKTYKYMKQLINQAAFSDIESILASESEYQGICIRTQDCVEGLSAFLEKRRANYTGK